MVNREDLTLRTHVKVEYVTVLSTVILSTQTTPKKSSMESAA